MTSHLSENSHYRPEWANSPRAFLLAASGPAIVAVAGARWYVVVAVALLALGPYVTVWGSDGLHYMTRAEKKR